jgi:F0F1-type ATP synthase assembly protein I
MSDKKDDIWVVFARYFSLALLLPVSTLVGYGMGYGLDHMFGTTFLKTVFMLLGSAAGFVQLIRGLG